MSLTKVTYSMIKNAPINVIDYGADPTGVEDSTTAIQAAFDVVAADTNAYSLVFPAGTYKYTVSPNYAVEGMSVYAQGEVVLQYEGTGNAVIFDGGSAYPNQVYDVQFLGNFIINGASTSLNGIYLRAVHHSKIQGHVRGCGTAGSGLKTEFSVCTEFWVKVTNNGSFGANQPVNGYSLGSRASNEQTSACTFYNPICEGVLAEGILLTAASNCQFIGGTSEGNNAGYGIAIENASCSRNTFHGIDLENNANSFIDYGKYNVYINCLFENSGINYGTNNTIIGGQFGALLTNNGSLNLIGVNVLGITNTGNLSKTGCYNISGSSFDSDLTINSLQKTVNSVPHNTATTIVTLPSTGSHFYNVYANSPDNSNATAYRAIATVYQDTATSSIITQTNGSNLTITLSGQNIQVTQTSGTAINVQVIAQAV